MSAFPETPSQDQGQLRRRSALIFLKPGGQKREKFRLDVELGQLRFNKPQDVFHVSLNRVTVRT
jgi:hypothetical protein